MWKHPFPLLWDSAAGYIALSSTMKVSTTAKKKHGQRHCGEKNDLFHDDEV